MTEEHRCTEECIEELEGVVEEIQAERNELSCRVQQQEEALREARPLIVHNYEGLHGFIGEGGRVIDLIDAALSRSKEGQKSE